MYAGARRGAGDRLEVLATGDRQLDVAGHRRREVRVHRVEPAEDRSRDAFGPERERLGHARHAEPGGAVRQGDPGDGGGTVSEAVGLHHRHQLAGRAPGEVLDVRGHRGQVHLEAWAGVVAPRQSEHGHAATPWAPLTGP